MKRFSTLMLSLLAVAFVFTSPLSAWSTKKYKVLSFDGGGIRSAISAQIIKMLDDEFDFVKDVDLFVGTSSGGVMAAGLASGLTPGDLVNVFTEHGKDMFLSTSGYDLLQTHAMYSRDGLDHILRKMLFSEHTTLSDLNKKVVLTAFKVHDEKAGKWHPENFDNFSQSDENVIDVLLRSCAYPGFFPSYQGYIDGSYVAVNPSMVGLVAAINSEKGNQKLKDITLLSVGTECIHDDLEYDGDVDWGIAEWVIHNPYSSDRSPSHPAFTILTDAAVELSEMLTEQLLKDRSLRISPDLISELEVDDYTAIETALEEVKKWPETRPKYWNSIRKWVKDTYLD